MNDDFWLDPGLKADFEVAKQSTAYYSKSFFLATQLLPKRKRWATYALYAFCRHIDNLVDAPENSDQTQIKASLDAFKQELDSAYASGQSQHPVIKSYIVVANIYEIPQEYPNDLLEGVLMDIHKKRYDNYDDLYVYCYRVAGVVGKMMTYILGFRDPIAFYYAEKMGVAMQLANILRDIQEDAGMDRIYLPISDLDKFQVSQNNILQSKNSSNLGELMRFQIDRAKQLFTDAEIGIPLLEKKSQFAIYSASKIYAGILDLIIKNNYNPFIGRVYVTKTKKLRLMLMEFIKNKLRFTSKMKHDEHVKFASQYAQAE